MYKKDESNRNDAAWRVQTKPQNSKNMSFLWFGLIEIDSSTQLTNHRATCMNKKSTLWVRARVPTKVVWLPFYVLQRKPFGVLGVLLDKLPNLLLCAMYYIYNVYIYTYDFYIYVHYTVCSKNNETFPQAHRALSNPVLFFFPKIPERHRAFKKNKMKQKPQQTLPPFPTFTCESCHGGPLPVTALTTPAAAFCRCTTRDCGRGAGT